jgi:asparagine synthase (glutamine-hydrolysing)
MQADVPLGAFLSGGFDSSTIVALMQAQSSRPVRTFTIGSRESGYDEAADARAVAAHLKTDHTELYVTPKEAQDVVPLLPALYDEPFGDSSQIPTYLVSKLARQHVTVALSGDGGDELFGGYQRYFLGRQIWNTVGWIPRPLRGAAAWGLRAIPRGFWSLMSPGRPRLGEQVHKLGTVLAADDPDAFYLDLVSLWRLDERLVIGAPESILEDAVRTPSADFARRMMQRDLQSYLPDDILVKVDRASMGVGLEARVPFLDPRVVEFAARLPMDALIRGGEGKRILREVLYRYVPRELVDRPKMGFGIPLAEWLQGPLREWAEDLLSEASLRTAGILRPEPIRAQWRMHVAGRGNAAYRIWNVLVFEQWRRSLAGT